MRGTRPEEEKDSEPRSRRERQNHRVVGKVKNAVSQLKAVFSPHKEQKQPRNHLKV